MGTSGSLATMGNMATTGQITSVYAAQAGHWYTREGRPAYTIIGKNGNERPTTLRDARALNLVPSVTMLIREAAKPQLETWKQQQVLMAALTLPKVDGESEADWIARILADSKEQAIKAAERGTQVHAWIQQVFEGQPVPDEGYLYYMAVQDELKKYGGDIGTDWEVEQSFAGPGSSLDSQRYGGKVDLHNPLAVLDIKTKDTIEKVALYDEHAMQIAAYRKGLNLSPHTRGGIVFVGVQDAKAKLLWIDRDQLHRGERMFDALVAYWYAKTGL
jgi:hypothetical protein